MNEDAAKGWSVFFLVLVLLGLVAWTAYLAGGDIAEARILRGEYTVTTYHDGMQDCRALYRAEQLVRTECGHGQ